jgi:DNA/RNA-binding domain of Phe-tRNA-synthetase-like protein
MISKAIYKEDLSTTIVIDEKLKLASPNLKLGIITADVLVEKKNDIVWNILQNSGNSIREKYTLENLILDPQLQSARDTYKRLGKDPSRYRVSSEALMRRALQGKELYQINNVVDINNILSLEKSLSSGTYDLSKLSGNVSFRVGKQGESYKGIGKDSINIEDLPVFADENGPFGSPTSDSEKAMITINTKRIMMVLMSFSGDMDGQLQDLINNGSVLLKDYANATNIATSIVS